MRTEASTSIGEVVFTTGMVGYTEAFTDPSYRGQILVMTNPLVGNYGVNPEDFESQGVQVEGLVVYEVTRPSHYTSKMDLLSWFSSEGVPILERVDTRALVRKLRDEGVKMGIIWEGDQEEGLRRLRSSPRYEEVDYTKLVSPDQPLVEEPEFYRGLTVVAVDCGLKKGIVRQLLKRGIKVVRVPCWWGPDQIAEVDPDGLLLGNGPGNPSLLSKLGEGAVELAKDGIPILGICLGHQLIALGLGARTFKMKYGHRGQNKPSVDLRTGRCYVTSQNHGYAVDLESLKEANLIAWFLNPDDKTLEGTYHPDLPIATTQFHPEADPGPLDTSWVFDLFVEAMGEGSWRFQTR